nr:MAG TPA: hypothetical protein [Caudoviricetes sp.]
MKFSPYSLKRFIFCLNVNQNDLYLQRIHNVNTPQSYEKGLR